MRHGEVSVVPAQTVRRVARVLRAFEGRGWMGVGELCATTRLPRSSVHRIASALATEGLLSQDPDSRKYSLSLGVAAMGAGILRRHVVRRACRPLLMELRDVTRESGHLCIFEGGDVVVLDTEESYHFVRQVNIPGQRLPAHATSSGKVLLAHLSEGRQRALLGVAPLERFTERTITDPQVLLEELRGIRACGYAVSVGELEDGVDAIAAPIFDPFDEAVAALSVGGPSERVRPRRAEMLAAVRETSRRCSEALAAMGI